MNNEDRKEAERLGIEMRVLANAGFNSCAISDAATFLERLAAQPAQVPMTEEQLKPLFIIYCGDLYPEDIDLVRKIEAHHRITGDKK